MLCNRSPIEERAFLYYDEIEDLKPNDEHENWGFSGFAMAINPNEESKPSIFYDELKESTFEDKDRVESIKIINVSGI